MVLRALKQQSYCCVSCAAFLAVVAALGLARGQQQQHNLQARLSSGRAPVSEAALLDRHMLQLSAQAALTPQAPCPYLRQPRDAAMARYRRQVDAYIAGPTHQQWVASIKSLPNQRGILITAGGPKLVANVIILLKVSVLAVCCIGAVTHVD